MEDIGRYNGIINDLQNYYNTNKYYIFLEFKYLDMPMLEIDFANDFIIKEKQEKFIDFDYDSKKFTLSYNGGLNRYNSLKNMVLPNYTDFNRYIDYSKIFSVDDRARIINQYNISFNDYCYSEFLNAYAKRLINITSNDTFVTEEFLGESKEKIGVFFNEVLAEAKTREIATNRGLFYLPEAGYNNEILRIARTIILDDKLWRVVLTSDIKSLMIHLNSIQNNNIRKYEQYAFERKYKLPTDYFSSKEEEKILYKSTKARKETLKLRLKMILNALVGSGTSGFTSILFLVIWYIFIVALGILITSLLLGS